MNRDRLKPIALGLALVLTLAVSCRSAPELRPASLDNATIAMELAAEHAPESSPTEEPEFSLGRYLPDMDSGQFEDQLYARDGDILYILQRHAPGSRILVIDLAGDALVASVDLVGDEWFSAIGWSDAIRRLICLDPEGAIVLLDPADGWSQESIALEGPAFPRRLVIRGDLLLVAHHNETRLDAFDMRDGMIHLRRTYEVDGSNVAPLDDRRCLLGDVDLTLLDLETGEETKLINLPEWEEYATVIDNLVYDDAARAAYFRLAGYVYAYAADPAVVPAHAEAISGDEGGFRVNAGYLYRLDRDAYAYDKYGMGLLCMRRTGDEAAAEEEYGIVTDLTGGYDLPPDTLASRDYRLVLRFPLWSDPDDPEAEAERIRLRLAERYPGFLSLEPLED